MSRAKVIGDKVLNQSLPESERPSEGKALSAAMEAISRQPDSVGPLSRTLFVGLAMIETMAIYCLVTALLVLYANPFIKG